MEKLFYKINYNNYDLLLETMNYVWSQKKIEKFIDLWIKN